ncbi:ribonuclease VapC [Marinicella pacifica]|uniref:Ribonuclease VapC n=1 Tax=Marinicella pacifica TaxID=1171543 RepID=A0A917CRW6_9GAMM|nr:PIN domain nuclease [Marinicella pacifica]GGF97503.1 ribonuclease VapC [Marinicella pacifica]
MIIADTSIWIDYFNGVDSQFTDALDSGLTDGVIAIGDIIFLEILQGFKSDKDYNLAKKSLSTLERFEMFGHNQVLKAASNYRKLRKKGITIRKTNDVIIATFCIENKMPLLYLDKDFKPFVRYLGLIDGFKK